MNILSNDYYFLPDKLSINGENKSPVQREYYFENTENNIYNISLLWNNGTKYEASNMFKGCSNITEINFIDFNTYGITEISSMFDGCISLTHLNLSNFNTCNVQIYDYMFHNCISLTSLDLSNFDVSKASGFNGMFSGCSSLKYLDISNFKTAKFLYGEYIFSGCRSLEIINLKSAILKGGILNQLFDLSSPNLTICSLDDVWKTNFPKVHEVFCDNFSLSIDDNNNETLKCYTKQNSNILSAHSCEICGKHYYKIYNDTNKDELNIICYKSPIGFYLDKNNYLFKQCFSSCKKCEIGGNNDEHNCTECKDEYNYIINISNYKNCYKKILDKESNEIINDSFIYNIKDSDSYNYKTYNINNIYNQINNISSHIISSNIMENIFSSTSKNTIIEIIDNENMNKSIEEFIYFLLDDLNLTNIYFYIYI